MESENITLGNKPQEWTPETVFELMSKELGHPAYVAVADAHNAALAAAEQAAYQRGLKDHEVWMGDQLAAERAKVKELEKRLKIYDQHGSV